MSGQSFEPAQHQPISYDLSFLFLPVPIEPEGVCVELDSSQIESLEIGSFNSFPLPMKIYPYRAPLLLET
jgi:hypothetical protein